MSEMMRARYEPTVGQMVRIRGSRQVVSFKNGDRWDSRLYVSHGETATLTHATHKTQKGAQRWAEKILDRQP